jgi:hypothetical protein
MGVDQTHYDARKASKSSMDGIMGQNFAIDAIGGDGRNGTNDVACK